MGRDHELGVLTELVAGPPIGPRGALLDGEPGIGKTTLWEAAVDAARAAGRTVLRSSPSDADADLAFAVLTDLFKAQAAIREGLPGPQRHALAVALLEADASDQTDPRAVAAGVLTCLKSIAGAADVLLAIDDVQWIDPESDRALTYAFRRLGDDARVHFLMARRSGAGTDGQIVHAVERAGGERMTLGPLDADAIATILHAEHPTLSRLELAEIHAESGGNPFYAGEIARALERDDERPTGLALPVPTELRRDIVRARFADLSPTAREALLVSAAATRPTISLVAKATSGDVARALSEAEQTSVIKIDQGAISFLHPLYRSTIYAEASRQHRHQVHATLADIVDDQEERGRHLSLSAEGPNESIADEVEAAAAQARARGAPGISASLLANAIRLTPTDGLPSLARRLMLMGKDRCLAGDTTRGLADLARAVTLAEPGSVRAHALAELGAMEEFVYRSTEARAHLEAALQEEGIDDALRCFVHANLGLTTWPPIVDGGLTAQAADDQLRHVDEALALARTITELGPRASAYSAAMHATLLREGRLAQELVAEAPELWEELPALPMGDWPRLWLAYHLMAVGDPDGLTLVLELLDTAEARGDEMARAGMLGWVAEWMAETGEWQAGVAAAQQSFALEHQLYGEAAGRALVGWFKAAFGDAQDAREVAANSLEQERVIPWVGGWARGSIGLLELSLGRPKEALGQLEALGTRRPAAGTGNPRMSSFLADLIEALVAVGRLDEVDDHVAWLEERGATLDRPYASAAGARGRGLLQAARGDLDAALISLERALQENERVTMPFELARTLLIQGTIQRRVGKKRLARETLERARSVFDELGAALWSQRAEAELGHITGRRRGPGKLTDAERNVARLAAAGFRNREIAEQLFLSVRTVEGHLSDAYGKLGIRSRTELTQFIDELDDGRARPGTQ